MLVLRTLVSVGHLSRLFLEGGVSVFWPQFGPLYWSIPSIMAILTSALVTQLRDLGTEWNWSRLGSSQRIMIFLGACENACVDTASGFDISLVYLFKDFAVKLLVKALV